VRRVGAEPRTASGGLASAWYRAPVSSKGSRRRMFRLKPSQDGESCGGSCLAREGDSGKD